MKMTNLKVKEFIRVDHMGKHYIYHVTWSAEDKQYIGLCAEFPSLSWLDEDQQSALAGIMNIVTDSVSDMVKNNESVPDTQRKVSV